MTMRNFPRRYAAIMIVALLSFYGCTTSPEFVSEISVEDKIARLRIGESDKSAVENIFGPDHGSDRNRWIYQFADKQFEISERRQGPGLGALPVSAGVIPTNTRAVVTVGFSEAGIVKAIEVARFFEQPFINDYWFLVNQSVKDPLESVAAISESAGFKVAGLDKDAGTFNLEDPRSKARLAVKLDGQILKITSRNPHHRLANEYRAYVKRESALTNGIANSDLVQ
ncbi:MAG: hypothetical protein ACREP3_01125 [Candidatus Binatia bacterium]